MNRIASRFTTLLSFRAVTAPVNQARAAWVTGEAAFLLAIDSSVPSLLELSLESACLPRANAGSTSTVYHILGRNSMHL